jgi:hypothetical protein
VAGRPTEGLHQCEIGGDAYHLQPVLHVAAHEGRIFLSGNCDDSGDRVGVGGGLCRQWQG